NVVVTGLDIEAVKFILPVATSSDSLGIPGLLTDQFLVKLKPVKDPAVYFLIYPDGAEVVPEKAVPCKTPSTTVGFELTSNATSEPLTVLKPLTFSINPKVPVNVSNVPLFVSNQA